ncbi:hypothetical protein ACN38_g8641 [Penicillium nordicum]|uniref:Uncharacterized protein n=1 Tax=Penicillium nordicum TaxID=229535 RepID=A0A0M8NW23_9EURO|nr:hypothetical protein ACN38_g8641 [Penicillium nordicum]
MRPLCRQRSSRFAIRRSHGLVVKRMTSNHEILGSTPSVSIFLPFLPTIIVGISNKQPCDDFLTYLYI